MAARPIGLLLIFASQGRHNVQDEMAEFVVLLRKEIKDGLTKQGMQSIRGPHRKRLAKWGEKERTLF